ncbi:GatB/YqeY domain-containing protein [Patescibacteria group bacterium]|nr:GatB/YqeY domain-containing protein [Patescibacteria group bacterium]MBU4338571.1 GatB/YqeY domain-containing protein [Patescibacteria group bacterium]MBU4579864.1 GatB/YqeY domain-containing protein [Patescibacteria group bacterium]
MSLKGRISRDLIIAVKGKDRVISLVLRSLNAAIKNAEIIKRAKLSKSFKEANLEKASVLTDEEIIGVISSQIKQRKDSISEFEKANRLDLVEKEKEEMTVLAVYLPPQMSEVEVRKIVSGAIVKTGASSAREMGRVMAFIMPLVKGKADGAMVSGIVKELLSK